MARTQTSSNSTKSKWREFLDAAPILQFIGAGLIGLVATWTTIQLTQNSQASEIRRSAEKIEKLERESVAKDLFEERTKTIIEKQKEQSEMLQKIFDKYKK